MPVLLSSIFIFIPGLLSSLRLRVRSRARVRRFAGVEASLGDLGALAITQCHATDTGSQHDCGASSSSGAASSPPSPSQSLSAPLTPAQWCELLRGHDMRLIVGIYSSWCEVRTTLCIREWQYEMFLCVQNQRRSLQIVFESHRRGSQCFRSNHSRCRPTAVPSNFTEFCLHTFFPIAHTHMHVHAQARL